MPVQPTDFAEEAFFGMADAIRRHYFKFPNTQ
jgi:hypothetical protein